MLDSLIEGFEAGTFCSFLRSKYPSFSESRRQLRVDGDSFRVFSAVQLGVVKSLPGPNGLNKPMLVVAVSLPDGETLRERGSRVRQFNFARKVIAQALATPLPGVTGAVTQGLFVFHDDAGNFRLSLVHGKAEGTKLVWSTAKRLSFHVEAGAGNKTFRDRARLDWGTFDKLKDAFSVEKLTKEFYAKLFDWYQWALSDEMGVTYPNNTDTDDDERDISEHIIRLITRLMFVWFLKQKHLVPGNLFDPAALKTILKSFDPLKGDNYYRAILQNLFFATLNSEIPERAFARQTGDRTEHFDIKTLYRYPKAFAISETEVLRLFENIPFLNGGLFECLDRGTRYSDGFSRNTKKQAHLPNRLFFDHEKGLIPLLSQYHFTVEENSPGDEEIALDPELLGKVFENLLGAYNPETKVAARNATGSFYTPREIVNYMVDESLKAHVLGKLTTEYTEGTEKGNDSGRGIEVRGGEGAHEDTKTRREEAAKQLFENGDRPEDETLCRRIDDALVTAKILDPACGSGAFPMGILLRMVGLLRILRNIADDDHTAIYDLKLQLIENCIYGGDIQSIAVQISKLRFFISLVCEQKPTRDPKKNYGIHTLPNLETKFVAADSLLGLPRSGDSLPMANVEKLKKDLWQVRHKHFLARTYQEKKELRKDDKKLRTTLAKALEEGGGFDTDAAAKMAAWDPYDQNTSATWFDPEWMFNVKDGFDIVIGNPPYMQIQKLPEATKSALSEQGYATFSKTADLYCLFYERGGKLLGRQGNLCYITSNKFFRSGYGKPLRQMMTREYTLHRLIDFGELPVFEAGTDPVIVQFGRNGNKTLTAVTIKHVEAIAQLPATIAATGFDMEPSALSQSGWSLGGVASTGILDKMRAIGMSLGEYVNGEIYRGVLTGFNEAFILDDAERNALIAADPKSAEIIKPLAKGDDVRKWHIRDKGRWLILTKNGTDMKRYPAVMAHLKQWEPQLRKRQDQGVHWWELRACAYYDVFEKPKIVYPEISRESRFACDDGTIFPLKTIFSIPSADQYLLGVLNTRCSWHFLKNTCSSLGDAEKGGRLLMQAIYLQNLPIPSASPELRKVIESLVDRILAAKKADPEADTSAWEAEIDRLVYELYGLTAEEIAIVEAASRGATQGKGSVGQKSEARGPSAGIAKKVGASAAGKKPAPRKLKPNLPPSLPGWD